MVCFIVLLDTPVVLRIATFTAAVSSFVVNTSLLAVSTTATSIATTVVGRYHSHFYRILPMPLDYICKAGIGISLLPFTDSC